MFFGAFGGVQGCMRSNGPRNRQLLNPLKPARLSEPKL